MHRKKKCISNFKKQIILNYLFCDLDKLTLDNRLVWTRLDRIIHLEGTYKDH